jgi:hypothetical protein
MATLRRFEPEELLIRPGTYFNPQTEVLIVVDDSPELDAEIFSTEEEEGADWVLISDEVPLDEHQRDELLERFSVRHEPGRGRRSARAANEHDLDEEDDLDDEDDDELDEDDGFDEYDDGEYE